MAVITIRGNEALNVNPPAGDQQLSVNGSNWLWAVCALFGVAFIVMNVLAAKPKAGERIFHYIFMVAFMVSTIAYFAMASDLGYAVIPQVDGLDRGVTRQIFVAKYINWAVSWPAIFMALGIASGMSWAMIIFNMVMVWIAVVSWLVGAFIVTNYKWGFHTFAILSWNWATSTLFHDMPSIKRVGIQRDFFALALWLCLMMIAYSVAFGTTEGGNAIGVVGATIFFGVLDILTILCIPFAMIGLSSRWDYAKMNLYFTQYGRVPRGADMPEKSPAPAGGVVEPQTA
jgi:bacteriorhodopsin